MYNINMNKHLIFITHQFDSLKENKNLALYAIVKTILEYKKSLKFNGLFEFEMKLFSNANLFKKNEKSILRSNGIELIEISDYRNEFINKHPKLATETKSNNLLVNMLIAGSFTDEFSSISILENDLIFNDKIFVNDGINIFNYRDYNLDTESEVDKDFLINLYGKIPESKENIIVSTSLPTAFINVDVRKIADEYFNLLENSFDKGLLNINNHNYNWIYYGTLLQFISGKHHYEATFTHQLPLWFWAKNSKNEDWNKVNMHRNPIGFKRKEFHNTKIDKIQLEKDYKTILEKYGPDKLKEIFSKKDSIMNYYKRKILFNHKFENKCIRKIMRNEAQQRKRIKNINKEKY